MTQEQEHLLRNKINSILELSNAIGICLNDTVCENIISYYRDLVSKVGFDKVIKRLNEMKSIINSSTIGPILVSMINNAKKSQKIKTK